MRKTKQKNEIEKKGGGVDGKRNKGNDRETVDGCDNMPPTVVSDNKTISGWPKLTFVFLLFPRALKSGPGTSLAVQWLRLYASNAGDAGSIPGWGAKIPHAAWSGQKKSGPDFHKLIFHKRGWGWGRDSRKYIIMNLYTLRISLHPGHFLLNI